MKKYIVQCKSTKVYFSFRYVFDTMDIKQAKIFENIEKEKLTKEFQKNWEFEVELFEV